MAIKVALVTGASSGIGEATARQLLSQGFRVYAGARRVDRMSELAAAGASTIQGAVTDDSSMTRATVRMAPSKMSRSPRVGHSLTSTSLA